MSERKFYQKITDIYATALDYDISQDYTPVFFNKNYFYKWCAEEEKAVIKKYLITVSGGKSYDTILHLL